MSKTTVSNDSWGTPEARRDEALRILKIMEDNHMRGSMTDKEGGFVDDISERLTDLTEFISPKQLIWLREIKDKY